MEQPHEHCRIVGSFWTRYGSQLRMICVKCHKLFFHPSRRCNITCPHCGNIDSLFDIRKSMGRARNAEREKVEYVSL
jgi:hypothetical protein